MLGKIFGLFFAGILVAVLAFQAMSVDAKKSKSPITGPITSPTCKPGWGYGDKNHCHSGPPGLIQQSSQSARGNR